MKKRALIIIVAILMAITFIGCNKNASSNEENKSQPKTQVKQTDNENQTNTNNQTEEKHAQNKVKTTEEDEAKNDSNKNKTSVIIPQEDKVQGKVNYIEYVMNKVPEIDKWGKEIEKNSKGSAHVVVYIENQPNKNGSDKYMRDYYTLYVGEAHTDHTVNICRFLVHKDTKEILAYDVISNKYLTLQEWRKTQQ